MSKVKPRRSRPRTEEQINDIMLRYYDARAKGDLALDAADYVKVPLSSITRWQRQQKFPTSNNNVEISSAGCLSLDQAISRLCDLPDDIRTGGQRAYMQYVEALATFVTWLRWPKSEKLSHLGVSTYVLSYVYKAYGAISLAALTPDVRDFCEGFIRLDLALLMHSEENLEFPSFYDFPNVDDQPQDENGCLVDLITYVIAHGTYSKSATGKASVGKAIYLAHQNAFRYRWRSSSFKLRKLWRERGVSAPFLYARDNFSVEWPLNPSATTFQADVDTLLADARTMREYFEKALWTVQKTKSILDPKALRGLPFPRFPSSLEPVPINVLPLSKRVRMILQTYRSADKTLEFFDD